MHLANFFRNEKLEIVENKDILIDLVFTDIESLIGLTFKKFLCRIIRSKNSSKQTLSVVRRNVDQSKSFRVWYEMCLMLAGNSQKTIKRYAEML